MFGVWQVLSKYFLNELDGLFMKCASFNLNKKYFFKNNDYCYYCSLNAFHVLGTLQTPFYLFLTGIPWDSIVYPSYIGTLRFRDFLIV